MLADKIKIIQPKSSLDLNYPIDVIKKQLEAKEKWIKYQQENNNYSKEEIQDTKLDILSLEMALNILKEKRREFSKGLKLHLKYLSLQ